MRDRRINQRPGAARPATPPAGRPAAPAAARPPAPPAARPAAPRVDPSKAEHILIESDENPDPRSAGQTVRARRRLKNPLRHRLTVVTLFAEGYLEVVEYVRGRRGEPFRLDLHYLDPVPTIARVVAKRAWWTMAGCLAAALGALLLAYVASLGTLVVSFALAAGAAALVAFELASAPLERAVSGLINPAWYVRSRAGAQLVLQRLNPIFPAEVNLDIAAVTCHLAAKGVLTPTLFPSRFGQLWFEHDGSLWRVLTRIEGVTRDALEAPEQAREAGRVLAEFHRAVADLDHVFRSHRLGVHDTARHLRTLRDALHEFRAHRDFESVRPLAERVLALAADLPALPAAPDRI